MILGSNGYGILQVSEKDISLNDFKTEADYINNETVYIIDIKAEKL